MNICNAIYNIKIMSGEVIPISFSYLLDFDLKHFKMSFIFELRNQFKNKNIHFDQLNLFDDKQSLYYFNYIPEDNYCFQMFIEESNYISEEEIDYYKNIWKEGEQFKTYLIWCEKTDKLNYKVLYCGAGDNYIMSGSFTDKEWLSFIKDLEDSSEPLWVFPDERSYFRYVYETGNITIN